MSTLPSEAGVIELTACKSITFGADIKSEKKCEIDPRAKSLEPTYMKVVLNMQKLYKICKSCLFMEFNSRARISIHKEQVQTFSK